MEGNGTGRHLVIGMGEVGQAIFKILSEKYSVDSWDIKHSNSENNVKGYSYSKEPKGKFDVIHIAFPFGASFIENVKAYKEKFGKPGGIVVIHSSVAVGTTRMLGRDYVHSPIRGIHPYLESGIRTFVKFFGGLRAQEAAEMFVALGIKCQTVSRSDDTEAMKLWDTTQYGLNVIIQKMIFEWCWERGIDFNIVYTRANETYNEGYEALGHPEFKKYVLKPMQGKVGGHCIMPNAHLLSHELTKFLIEQNDQLPTS